MILLDQSELSTDQGDPNNRSYKISLKILRSTVGSK